MYESPEFAEKRRSANRFVVGVGVLALAGAGAFLYFGWKDGQEARRGPTPLTAEQLKAAASPEALPARWVTLTPDNARDTGVRRHFTTRNGAPRPTLEYALVQLDDRYLIVETYVASKVGSPLTGNLYPWRGNDVVKEVQARAPACRDKLLPFYLATQTDPVGESRAVWVGAGACALVGLGLVAGGLVGLRNASAAAGPGAGGQAPSPSSRRPTAW